MSMCPTLLSGVRSLRGSVTFPGCVPLTLVLVPAFCVSCPEHLCSLVLLNPSACYAIIMLMLSHFLLSTSALAATSAPAAKLAHAAIVARPIDLCFASTTALADMTAYCRHGHYYPHTAPVPCAIAPAPVAVTARASGAFLVLAFLEVTGSPNLTF